MIFWHPLQHRTIAFNKQFYAVGQYLPKGRFYIDLTSPFIFSFTVLFLCGVLIKDRKYTDQFSAPFCYLPHYLLMPDHISIKYLTSCGLCQHCPSAILFSIRKCHVLSKRVFA